MTHREPITLSGSRDPWERQPRESDKMYARFAAYLELGRARTLTQAREILTATGDELSPEYVRSLSHTYRWAERVGAWDREQSRLEAERLVEQRRDLIARYRSIGTALSGKARRALDKLDAETLTPLDIARFLRVAYMIESSALGLPVETVGVSGPDGGAILVDDLGRLSPDERRERLSQLAAEIGRRSQAPADDTDAEDE